MLYGKLYRFEIFHVTGKRAFCIFVRAVSFGKSRKYVRSAHTVFGCRGCAVGRQLYTRNVIAAGVAVYSVREGRAVYLAVNNLELVKQIFIIATFGFRAKFKREFLIICGVALSVVTNSHLDFVLLVAGG